MAGTKDPEAPPSGPSVALTSRPVSRASTLARAAIVERLRGLTDARAVMLCAPAGYGKTTVLLQWSEADERAFAWVTVDDLDDDPAVFIRHLLAALSAVEPVDPEVFTALGAAEPHFSATVLPLLARTIRERSVPFVLVLDDLGGCPLRARCASWVWCWPTSPRVARWPAPAGRPRRRPSGGCGPQEPWLNSAARTSR